MTDSSTATPDDVVWPDDPAEPGSVPRPGPARPDARIGQVLDGRYRLVAVLSSGSMGRVYRAQQLNLDRVVAIKLMDLDPTLIRSPEVETYEKRFANEASALARLQHPNTVRIFDFGFADGVPYIVMEFIEGRPLSDIIRRDAPMPVARVVTIAEGICASLAEAHAAGIIHRDLKQGNIIVTTDLDGTERAKVLDFGLVKLAEEGEDITQMGQLLGSPNYMAPEIIREEADLDGRADVYALGVILFRMLSGHLPFARERPASVLIAHLQLPVPPLGELVPDLDLPPVVEWTVARCLEKDRNQRLATVTEVRTALLACSRAVHRTGAWHLSLDLVDGEVRGPSLLLQNDLEERSTATLAPPPLKLIAPPPIPEPTPHRHDGLQWKWVAGAALFVLVAGWAGMMARSSRDAGRVSASPMTVVEAPPTDLPPALDGEHEPDPPGAAEPPPEPPPEPPAPPVARAQPAVPPPAPVPTVPSPARVEPPPPEPPPPPPEPAPPKPAAVPTEPEPGSAAPPETTEPAPPPAVPDNDVWLDDDLKNPFE